MCWGVNCLRSLVRITRRVAVVVAVGQTFRPAFQQPIAKKDLSAHLQQPITSQLIFHSFNNIQRKREDREDGVEAQVPLSVPPLPLPPNSYR